jgi:Mg2+ and Co2+ transporter CorA
MTHFDGRAGLSSIPLMTDEHGVWGFWVMSLGCVAVFLFYLKYKKRWI